MAGGEAGRELGLGVRGTLSIFLACLGLPPTRSVGRAPAAAGISSWAPKQYPGRSQPKSSLCLGGAWGMAFEGEFLLDVSDGF